MRGGCHLSHSDTADRMRRALAAVAGGEGSHRELEEAAHELVTELRQANHPPEQMLLRIKEILAEMGLRPTYTGSPDLDSPFGNGAVVYRDVIAWSIRSYYDGGDVASER